MIQTQKKWQNASYWPWFSLQIRATKFFYKTRRWTLFQAMILCNLKENEWTKFGKMAKNLISSPILVNLSQIRAPQFFSWVLLDVRHCHNLSIYAILRKTYDPNTGKWRKTSFWGTQIDAVIFFQKYGFISH